MAIDNFDISSPVPPVPLGANIYVPGTVDMSTEWIRWFDDVYKRLEDLSNRLPLIETIRSAAGQVVFNTTNSTFANTTRVNLEVIVNGLYKSEGSTFNYVVTGPNQITFTTSLSENDVVVIKSYK